jgi:hypothetical protein
VQERNDSQLGGEVREQKMQRASEGDGREGREGRRRSQGRRLTVSTYPTTTTPPDCTTTTAVENTVESVPGLPGLVSCHSWYLTSVTTPTNLPQPTTAEKSKRHGQIAGLPPFGPSSVWRQRQPDDATGRLVNLVNSVGLSAGTTKGRREKATREGGRHDTVAERCGHGAFEGQFGLLIIDSNGNSTWWDFQLNRINVPIAERFKSLVGPEQRPLQEP